MDGEGVPPIAADPAPTTEQTTDSIETTEVSIALQLIGFHSREELNAFLSDQAMPNPFYILSETFQDRPWFALIHSLHEDRAAAGAAVEALPAGLARLDLWVRELPAGTTLERIQIKTGD
jgi:DamX protein